MARYDVFRDTFGRMHDIVAWGPSGVNFLLEEYTTNRYGHSNESGVVMDMSYPNWRERKYSNIIDQSQVQYHCKHCGNSGTIYIGSDTCPNCGNKL